MTDPAIKMLTEMVAALRQENYKRQESIELLTARVEGFRVAAQYPSQLAPAALIDALVKAECALSDIAEGEPGTDEGDAVRWAENRCSDTLAIIRPVMQQHGIRTSEWPPAPQPVSPPPTSDEADLPTRMII